jgi:anti-sigma factor RsiW
MTAPESGRGWDDTALQAYHDGELGFWARRRVERRLARSSELRRELAELSALGDLVREGEAPVAVPDLWEGIARGLRSVDAERAEADWAGRRLPMRHRGAVGALLAAGAAATALAFALLSGDTAPAGVVHWVDGGDRNVMVLDGEGDVTVIWVFDPVTTGTGASRGGWRGSA